MYPTEILKTALAALVERKKGRLLLGSAFIVASNMATANDLAAVTQPESAAKANTMLITGSPTRQRIEGVTKQLEEYDNQVITDAGDLLKRFSGFSGSRAGGHAVDPVLRGQSQTRLNFLQQGAFVHGAGPNRMDSPSAYTEPFGWDEVQIIKGIETLTQGSGGPAGSVNFKRHKPELSEVTFDGKIIAAYSPDYYKAGADLAAGSSSGYIRLISQMLDKESYEDGDGRLTHTAFATTSSTIIGAYTPSEDKEIRLSLMANRGTDALFAGTMMDGPITDMEGAQLLFMNGNSISEDFSAYQVYWNRAHHVMDNYRLRKNIKPTKMLTESHAKTTGAKWLKHWKSDRWVWETSFDWQLVKRHAQRYMDMAAMKAHAAMAGNTMQQTSIGVAARPNKLQARIWPHNNLEIFGVAVEGEYLLNENQRVKSGIRFDKVEAVADALNMAKVVSIYQDYYKNTPASANEDNISAFSRYYHNSDRSLYWGGLSSVVRTADATERYLGAHNRLPMMRWIGNPDIQPEQHNQLELGAKWRFTSGWHELNIYYDAVDDFILRDRARGQRGVLGNDLATIYRNVDARLAGFEWALNSEVVENWFVTTNLSYVDGKNKETSMPLYQIPPLEGSFQLSYQQGDKLAVWAEMHWALKQDEVDDSPMTGSGLDAGESENWSVFNLKVRYNFTESWQLAAGIDNLWDKTYAYHVNRANSDPFNPEPVRVNEPGRQMWVSVLFEF